MCSKQSKRFKSKCVKHDSRNKWLKNLTKPISCKCKCKLDGKKCNSNQNSNNDICKNIKYLASIIGDSVIMCDEIIKATVAITIYYNKKTQSIKQKYSIFYLLFYELPLRC